MTEKPKATETPVKTETPEAKTTEPAVVKPQANSDLDTVLNELKRFGGRLTKLEQRTKGNLPIKISKPDTHFSFDYPEENEQAEEEKMRQEKELVKVERGITRLIRDQKYREVFEKDKTLTRILENNPLALLSEEVLDADDALNQITNILDESIAPMSEKTNRMYCLVIFIYY